MVREDRAEILEQGGVPEELIDRAYRDLATIHRWLGDTRFVVRAIRRNPLPVHQVLDIGSGTGLVTAEIERTLGVRVVGVDISPYPAISAPVTIVQADARKDPLPCADVAFSLNVAHHLSAHDLIDVIRNVGRYCRRFIIVDLVRHRLPLALYRLFVAPFVCAIDAEDGQRSIRRSYSPDELREITSLALAGSGGAFEQSVSPFYIRQAIDITYSGAMRSTID
jgi:SAM-dependent methyltransferase